MKKNYLIIALLALTGCQTPQLSVLNNPFIDVSWEQDGKDCIYQEKTGTELTVKNEKGKLEKIKYASDIKTIKYGNTSCEKVIDAELKNKTNKSAITNRFHQLTSSSTTNISNSGWMQ
ncbi:MAG: hypothetical protein J5716_03060 [Alphaproteobacteria bacterium]|nr:hypothetical protein [Alphaproteobacteria bacterium]